MYHPIGSRCFPALINNCQWSLRQLRPAPAVFYTAKGRQFTGTTAGARNEQTQEALSLCKTNANFHILMVALTPPPKCQYFVLLSANERTRGSCSFSLRERPAQDPWQSLATGGRAVGWNSEHQEEPLCSWPVIFSFGPALQCLYCTSQGRLDWCEFFVKSSFLYQPSSSDWGKGHSQMGSASQLCVKWWRYTDLVQLVPRTAPFWPFHYSIPPQSPQDLRSPLISSLSTTTVTQLKVLYRQNIPHVTLQAAQVKSGQGVTARNCHNQHIPISRSRQRISEILFIFEVRKLNAQH